MLVRSKEECKTVNGSYLMQKDSDAVKEALNQLSEMGWAKKWSSQPYISRRTVSWSDKLWISISILDVLSVKFTTHLCALDVPT